MSAKHNNPRSYKGYIVTLNTLARSFPDTREDIREYCDHIHLTAENPDYDINNLVDASLSHHLQAHVTYGDFDRVTFNGVDRFPRFYDLDQRSKYWLGKHQCVFLYQIGDEGESLRLFPYQEDSRTAVNNDFGFCISNGDDVILHSALKGQVIDVHSQTTKEGRIYPFFLLSQISFSNDVLTRVKDFSEFIKDIRSQIIKELDQIIDEEHLDIKFEVYGCLNTSEISILWLARQYTDAFYLIDVLKGAKFLIEKDGKSKSLDLFLSFYSVLGRTLTNKLWSFGDIDTSINECIGMAQIDITIGNDKSLKEFYELLIKDLGEEVVINGVKFGEYDLSLIVPFKTIYNANCETPTNVPEDAPKKGFLKNTEIKELILGTKVTPLSQEIKKENFEKRKLEFRFENRIVSNGDGLIKQFNELTKELKITKDEDDKRDDERIRSIYMEIRAELKKSFNSHTGAVDTLDMLFTDYLSNIHASYNALWRNDYHYQFKRTLEYLRFILNKTETDRKFWDLYTLTINNVRQQTEHFAQSGRLVMQIPASHLRYTASCDMMFHSYYGETKVILEDIYYKQGKYIESVHQSELLPIITTNSSPVFRSMLYVAGNNCHDLRILQIDIPYSLLFDPVAGFPYLIHELFHFITPKDRMDRNRQLFNIAVNEALSYTYLIRFTSLFSNYFLEKEYFENEFEYASADEYPYFTNFMGVAKNNKGARPDLFKVLKNNLAHFMLNDKRISEIRKELVDQILEKGEEDYNEASWHKAKELFKNAINRLSVDTLNSISLSILDGMSVIDKLKKEKKYSQLNQLFFEGKYIGVEIGNESGNASDYSAAIKTVEDYLYSNRMSIFSAYEMYINSHSENTRIMSLLNDHFFSGIREAIPDYAMVKYCKMSDIDYLIYYTRSLRSHKNFDDEQEKKTIGQQEILRLYSILIWISKEPCYVNNGFKQFHFEKHWKRFLKAYIADRLSQEYDKERLFNYVVEAVFYYCRYLSGLQAYKRDYGIYYDYIVEYGKNYEVYFQGKDTNVNSELSSLIETVCEQRKNKMKRKEFIKKSSWKKIIKLSRSLIEKYNGEVMPNYREIEKALRKLKLINHREKTYDEKMGEYNRASFENELGFVQTSIRQKTFKMLADEKKEWYECGNSMGADDKKSEKKSSKDSNTEKTINQYTTYRIWDMQQLFDVIDWVRAYLYGDSGKTDIWYCVKYRQEPLLPSALKNVNGQCNENQKSIFRLIQDDLHAYYQRKGSSLKGVSGHEVIAKMTIDEPGINSNLIPFKRNLIDCMKEDAFDESVDNTSIYLFSEKKYIEARNQLFKNPEFKKSKREAYGQFVNTPLVLGNSSEDNNLNNYIITNTTENTIVNYESKLTLPLDLKFAEKVELLPMTLSFANLDRDEYFVAYDLRTPFSIKNGREVLSLDNLQTMFIESICKNNKESGGKTNLKEITRKNAFLYRIDIGYDTVRQLKLLEL